MNVVRASAVAIALLFPVLASAEPGGPRGACMNDVKTLCGSVQPGGGRIRECMREHRAELSSQCKLAIADRMLERRKGDRQGPRRGPGEKSED